MTSRTRRAARYAAWFGWLALLTPPALAASTPDLAAVLKRSDASLDARIPVFPPKPEPKGEERTLAPYFYVEGKDPETDRLPLKGTSARVEIAGVLARVKLSQVFENNGRSPIEAVYVFPASTRAAVHGMRMRIGERTVKARIERRQAAREQYEQAREQGRRASLLEQERPNVFTMNVANVMPGDRIEVELDYSELLVPEEAVYELVLPSVVGPRYGGGADPKKDKWIASPYLKEGQKSLTRYDVQVHLETGIPIKEIASPSHAVAVSYRSPSSADVRLLERDGGNKDYVLRYRLAGDRIESGLLLWKGEKEGFFALMMEPPQRPNLTQIPPREYVFLLDVSGSMHGFPLDTAKALMENLLQRLRPTDSFNVVFFSGGSWVLNPEGSVAATPGNVRVAIEAIRRQRGGGGTELMDGLRTAYGLPRKDKAVSRTVVVVTDGYVGVEAQAFKHVRERLNEANLFAFGIGSSVNRALIEALARAGQGEPFVVLRPEKAPEEASKLQALIEQPVLTRIEVRFDGFQALDVAPMKVPDLLARRPLVVFGRYAGAPRGAVEVRGYSGSGRFEQRLAVRPEDVKDENAPLRWLWARKWVELLEDQHALGPATEIEEAITDLGLSHRLLTRFTSFVAVDSAVVNPQGVAQQVVQPLPLPEGVSNYAVGAPAPAGLASLPLAAKTFRKETGRAQAQAPQASALVDESEKPAAESVQAILVVDVSAKGLGDAVPLIQAVEATLRPKGLACCGGHATVKLRLTVDARGRVTRVQVLSAGDERAARCLARLLEKLSSKTRATAKEGALDLTLRC